MAKTINTGFDDAQSVNQSSKTTFVYRDISLYFTPNPVSGDVTQITDVQDIKRSVRNLVLTNRWDRPFHPEIASRVRESLFELFTPITFNIIRTNTDIINDTCIINNIASKISMLSSIGIEHQLLQLIRNRKSAFELIWLHLLYFLSHWNPYILID